MILQTFTKYFQFLKLLVMSWQKKSFCQISSVNNFKWHVKCRQSRATFGLELVSLIVGIGKYYFSFNRNKLILICDLLSSKKASEKHSLLIPANIASLSDYNFCYQWLVFIACWMSGEPQSIWQFNWCFCNKFFCCLLSTLLASKWITFTSFIELDKIRLKLSWSIFLFNKKL